MSNDVLEKKQRFGDVQFDSSARDVGCVFCPYTVDNRQDWVKNIFFSVLKLITNRWNMIQKPFRKINIIIVASFLFEETSITLC